MPASLIARSGFAAALLLSSLAGALAAESRTITVSGQGIVSAPPDMAVLSAGVVSQAATAGEALSANSAATQRVIDQFKADAIEQKDIQTSNFSLQPVFVYPKNEDGLNPPRITGYTVSNTVSVRVRDLSRVGAVLDKVVGAGANTINGVEFVVSRQSELLDRARTEAVADAKRKAALYTSAAGASLGPVVTLSEQVSQPPSPRPMMRMEAAGAPVPIAAGESQLQVEISVTFVLQ